jgi:hypothetical protein
MRRFRLLLAAFALTFSTVAFASVDNSYKNNKGPISSQVEHMISDSNLVIEEDFYVTVIFKITKDKKIEIRSIESPHAGVNSFLKGRLENQRLYGNSWDTAKIYELPVKVQAKR